MNKIKPLQAPAFLSTDAASVEQHMRQVLAERQARVPKRLWDAMSYALMAGGKRVRPALLLACFRACGGCDASIAMPAATSIECMHTYSLIHDDLPCMDDDDLRRGQATCHKQFDEATAVLAGDALQTLAFECLANMSVSADIALRLTQKLALAAGDCGMVGGQMLDMEAEDHSVQSVLEVERIHIHKTGALIRYSCEAGAILAGASAEQQQACRRYGEAVGLLFQIADDILDATADTSVLGKSAGKDAAQHKATYVSLEGLQGARALAENMHDIALQAVQGLEQDGQDLVILAHYIMGREQ